MSSSTSFKYSPSSSFFQSQSSSSNHRYNLYTPKPYKSASTKLSPSSSQKLSFYSGPSKSLSSSSSSLSSSPVQWWRQKAPSCSPDELTAIIIAPRNTYEVPSDPYNQVFPNIYLGDGTTALCTALLRSLGITHVLNAACGKDRTLNLINTSKGFYRESGIKFFGIEALDMPTFCLSPYFVDAADFIDDAISNNGKVYVHCRMGISRSATLVLAYLMIKRGFSAQEAVRTVRRHREIIPNDGFLKQLCNLNEDLLQQKSMKERRDRLTSSYGNSLGINQ